MNIAIVDDEKVDLEAAEVFLRVYVKKFLADYESSIHIETFYSVTEFIQIFSTGLYQLVILGERVKELADFIRACGDYEVKIIFLKLNDDYDVVGGGYDYEYCDCRR